MNILIVEDDENNIALFQDEMALLGVTPVIARSRDAALNALNVGGFDLVVLDLRIPTVDGALDTDATHGLSVQSEISLKWKGTPVVVFSAYGTLGLVSDLLENTERHDVWGIGEDVPLVTFKEKTDFGKCINLIKSYESQVAALARIEVSTRGGSVDLNDQHKRILRIFARINGGQNVVVSLLSGGLSSARTVRVKIVDERGATTCLAVGKLDKIESIIREQANYHRYISPMLAVGGFAHEIRSLTAGAGEIGGIFYRFAEEFDSTLLQIITLDPSRAARVVEALRKLERDWHQGAFNSRISIRELRRGLVADDFVEEFADRLHPRWKELESIELNLRGCCQHSDLHPLNVLVRDDATPLLIDYGDVRPGPACLDPITLEFSLFFHPSCMNAVSGWPTTEQAGHWPNIDRYIEDLPISPYIRACRSWAFGVEESDLAVFATAYAYAVRQLKYVGTNHELALAFANAALTRIDEAAR